MDSPLPKALLLLLVLLTAGGAVWLFDSGDPEGAPDLLMTTETGSARDGPRLSAGGSAGAVAQPVAAPPPTGPLQANGQIYRGKSRIPARVDAWWIRSPPPMSAWQGAAASAAPPTDAFLRAPDWSQAVDADNGFLFSGLAQGRLVIRATSEKGEQGFATFTLHASEEPRDVPVSVAAGPHTLRLQILEADGTPFRGVVLLALEEGPTGNEDPGNWRGVVPEQTDEEGRVSFHGLQATQASPLVILPGVLRYRFAPRTVPHEGTYRLRMVLGQRRLRGQVVDQDDKPLEGASIFLRSQTVGQDTFDAWTRSNGTGTFDVAARGGPLSVHAKAPGHVPVGKHIEAGANDLTLHMARTCSIHGRVLDGAGRAIPGVPIRAQRSLGRWGNKEGLGTRSDTSGHFRLVGVPPGEITLFALGAGWVSRDLRSIEQNRDYNPLALTVSSEVSTRRDLIVTRSSSLQGTVRDAAGRPVAGARVRIAEQDAGGYFGSGLSEYEFGFLPTPPPAVTNKSGYFEILSLLSDLDYSLTAYHPSGIASETVRVRAGERLTVDCTLVRPPTHDETPWTVHVRVLDAETGEPIEEAQASCQGLYRTDARGETEADVRSQGRVQMRVTADGYFPYNQLISSDTDLEPGTSTARIVCSLRPSAEIKGILVFPDGRPAHGATVSLGARGSAPPGRSTWSNRDGSFFFGRLNPDMDALLLRAELFDDGVSYDAEVQTRSGETDLRIVLKVLEANPALKKRTVTVVGPQGRAVAWARVTFRVVAANEFMDGKLYLATGSDLVTNGELKMAPERVPFWIEVHEAQHHGGNALGPLLVGPFASTAEVPGTLRLPPARQIEGRVVDQVGVPVPGIQVTAVALRGALGGYTHQGTEHGQVRTDAHGVFRFSGLGDLPYRLSVSTPRRWRTPKSQDSKPRDDRTAGGSIEFRLVENLTCTITVVNERDEPIAGCSIHARTGEVIFGDALNVIKAETYQDGRGTLQGLSADESYTLEISPSWKRKDLLATTLQDWKPSAALTAVLTSAAGIDGQVVDGSGVPLPKAAVNLTYKDGEGGQAVRTDEDGRFAFKRLRPGAVQITVVHGPFRPASAHVASVPSTGVRLVHASGAAFVLDPPNAPAHGAPYLWRVVGLGHDKNRRERWGHGNWAGPLRLRGFDPEAAYTLWLYFPKENLLLYEADLRGDAGTRRTQLVPGQVLRGRLVLSDGKVLSEGGRVEVAGPAIDLSAQVGRDGFFEITGLPAGTWHVRAHAWRDLVEYEVRTKVTTGTPVELRLIRDE